MNILAIESSCDETAAAVISDNQGDKPQILSNVVVSQIDIFKAYGGVIPEVAARSHLEAIIPVVNKALKDANKTWNDITEIAVTHTPGLLGSLLIGTLTARTLAIIHNKPLYPVHHLKSHIYAAWLNQPEQVEETGVNMENSSQVAFSESQPEQVEGTGGSEPRDISVSQQSKLQQLQSEHWTVPGAGLPNCCNFDDCAKQHISKARYPQFPLLALVVSGGHTQILYMKEHNHFEIIGTTRDDAVGECFDKVAKILGLPYPGGPAIAKAAKNGDPEKYHFPHPHLTSPKRGDTSYSDLDFSFSGLKTAVLRTIQKELNLPLNHPSHDLKNHLTKQQIADFAASFQNTAVDILLENLKKAYEKHPEVKSIVIAGGVSANELLRKKALGGIFTNISASQHSCKNTPVVFFPDKSLSGDNAAMVGAAAFYEIKGGKKPIDPYHLDISPRSPIH